MEPGEADDPRGIMALRRQLSFGDASSLQGRYPPAVRAPDRALGGALDLLPPAEYAEAFWQNQEQSPQSA
ncbi:hypothetical protein DDQ41_27330 [Streptomyces spongiicola]|uniref:Uncharacterized protein n=2 Tax=Streptomyces spongiicola TaxID=1690221 RepID=A0ABM6VD82_9ACTN|nr:hypothetical protein DDQ41_27330 [Streptomyces spongiicola]